MRKISWRSRPATVALSAVGSVFVAGIGWAAAKAASAPTDGVIYGCVDRHGGELRVVHGPDECRRHEDPLTWNITGPTGATGAQGIQGVQGVQGIQGAVGAQGPAGPQGAIGPIGATGPQGLVGAAGAAGAQGPAGPQGPMGPEGPEGPAGGGSAAPAALTNVFLQLPGIKGPVTASGHEGWFDVSEFALAVSVPQAAGTGAGAGKAEWTLSATFAPDAATATIYTDTSSGKTLSTGKTIFEWDVKEGAAELVKKLQIELTDAKFTSTTSGPFSNGEALLNVTLTFSEVAFTAFTDAATGVVTADPIAKPATSFLLGHAPPAGSKAVQIANFLPPTPIAAGKFSEGSFTLTNDEQGVDLFTAAAAGDNLVTESFSVETTSGVQTADYTMTDARVPTVSFDGTTFTATINAQKYAWTFNTPSATGGAGTPVSGGWNLATNSGT